MIDSRTVAPGPVMSDLSTTGVQHASRFGIAVTRPNAENIHLHCDMAQVPSKFLRVREDYLSGMASPIPASIGYKVNSNVFQFIIEETWKTRKYFEDWQSYCFTRNKVRLLDEIAGTIAINALSTNGSGGSAFTNIVYQLEQCIPIQVVPTKLDAASLNAPVRFMVNIMCAKYTIFSGNNTTTP